VTNNSPSTGRTDGQSPPSQRETLQELFPPFIASIL
jgi:hypothetical protein